MDNIVATGSYDVNVAIKVRQSLDGAPPSASPAQASGFCRLNAACAGKSAIQKPMEARIVMSVPEKKGRNGESTAIREIS
jgi:hypothetical protein